jgi:hypothetical protein
MKGPRSIKELDPNSEVAETSGWRELMKNVLDLLKNGIWLFASLGYTAQNFILGGFS